MPDVELDIRDGIARILLNRPQKKNALRGEDWQALRDAAETASASEARVVVVRGAGKAFCAGFDVSEIEPKTTDAYEVIDGKVNPALRALRAIPVPTVAAVEGVCVGGGFGIAAACDISIAATTARFGAPYSAIGIMCDAGLHHFLGDVLGHQRAAYLIFTGRLLSAAEAQAMGLCCDVLPREDFEAGVEALVSGLANGPTLALRHSKRILRQRDLADPAMDAEALSQAQVFRSADANEGISAFLTGRKPTFTGR